MKIRQCDFCRKTIGPKSDFIRLTLFNHTTRPIKYQNIGDMCMKCFEKRKEDNK
jgi:hypothetical protein